MHKRCRKCRYQVSIDGHVRHCGYCIMTGRSRLGQLLKLLGVQKVTPYVMWLLDSQHCIFFTGNHRRKKRAKRGGS